MRSFVTAAVLCAEELLCSLPRWLDKTDAGGNADYASMARGCLVIFGYNFLATHLLIAIPTVNTFDMRQNEKLAPCSQKCRERFAMPQLV